MTKDPKRNIGIVSPEEALNYSGMEFLTKMRLGELPSPPFIHTMNIQFTKLEEGETIFSYTPTFDFYNALGCLHGGFISTLLDTAMACAIQSRLSKGQHYTTLEFKTNFLRPVYEKTGIVHADGRLIHFGRTTATAEGKLYDDQGKLYAFATTTCIIMR